MEWEGARVMQDRGLGPFPYNGRMHSFYIWTMDHGAWEHRWVWRWLCWSVGHHEPWTERPGQVLYCIRCLKDLPLDYRSPHLR